LHDYLTADNNLLTYDEQIQDLAIKREATSMRQSAKWGMHRVQSLSSQLKDTLHFEEHGEKNSSLHHFFCCLTYEQGWYE
jgi:hypothetical protein